MTEVRPGSVWADNDKRNPGRTVRVNLVDKMYAYCTVLTETGGGEPTVGTGGIPGAERKVRIRLNRMRPTASGYRLIEDAPE